VSNDLYEIHAPFRMQSIPRLKLRVKDPSLFGSRKHLFKFDLFPLHAPSVLNRHHGVWDLPAKRLPHDQIELTLSRESVEQSAPDGREIRLKPSWTGDLDLSGYCVLHVSLWEKSLLSMRRRTSVSSHHVIVNPLLEPKLLEMVLLVTSSCNLKCVMCRRQTRGDQVDKVPDAAVLNAAYEAAGSLQHVHVQGMGEPLLTRGVYEIFAELKKRMPGTSRLGTCTNGTVLDEEAARRLLDTGIDYVYFSVDGATKETYESIRIGSDFGVINKNIARLANMRDASRCSAPWLMMNFTIMEQHGHEIPVYAALAADLGVDSVRYVHLFDWADWEFRPLEKALLEPLFAEAREIGEKRGIKTVFPRHDALDENRCRYMQTAFVSSAGNVLPCAKMPPHKRRLGKRHFGNVIEQPLEKIWNGNRFRQFRHRVLTDDLPDTCVDCPWSSGLVTGG
jgi:radical SAM protein with 4Fe4S-binding SPASM domain